MTLSPLRAGATMLAAAAAVLPAVAAATPAVIVTGTFDGSWNGTAFAAQAFTFRGAYDPAAVQEVFDEVQHPLTRLDIVSGGTTWRATEPVMFFLSPGVPLAGFVDADATRGFLRFDGAAGNAFYTDDLTAPLATTGGALSLTDGRGIAMRFADVPEPATWTLMILGFASAGAALRRRGRGGAAVRFAPAA